MTTFNDFLAWEAHTRDTLDVKKIYIDMSGGDILAGLALSEIVFWNLPDKDGESKLRVNRDGHMWIASARYEWWERCRMTPRQSDRALKVLKKAGLIVTEVFKWKNSPTVHIRIVENAFLEKWNQLVSEPLENPFLPDGENGLINETVKTKILPDGEMEITKKANLNTETTTETTSETTEKLIAPEAQPAEPEEKPSDVEEKPGKPPRPDIALIDAYWAGLPGGKPAGADYPRYLRHAKSLVEDKHISAADVTTFMKVLYSPATEVWDYKRWHNTQIPIEELSKLLIVWKEKNTPKPKPPLQIVEPPAWMYQTNLLDELPSDVEDEAA